MVCLGKHVVIIPAVLFVKGNYIAVKGELQLVKTLFAAAAHILPCFAVIGKAPFCDASQTGNCGQVEEKDCVTVSQPMRDRAVEIAVDDPPRLFQRILEDGIKFLAA